MISIEDKQGVQRVSLGVKPAVALALGLCAFAPVAAAETVTCRAQISYDCVDACETGVGPADISIDTEAGTASFCRGSRCDDGAIETVAAKGQWDDADYVVFRIRGEAPSWSLVGVLLPDRRGFQALSDELGPIVGTCE